MNRLRFIFILTFCLLLQCVIKSYLQWLKDSDFDSTCSLCGSNLEDDDCIRLICYDLFHKKCLNERQKQLPANTAPSGHSCPCCSAIIFPPPNLVSPVADALRIWLSQTSWAGSELNMPMVSAIARINHQLTISFSFQRKRIFHPSPRRWKTSQRTVPVHLPKLLPTIYQPASTGPTFPKKYSVLRAHRTRC